MSVNCRLKGIKIIGQKKAFYRQRIPELSHVRKETAYIDILVTSRNGDRKIIQSESQVDLPREKGSGISSASSEEHLPQ